MAQSKKSNIIPVRFPPELDHDLELLLTWDPEASKSSIIRQAVRRRIAEIANAGVDLGGIDEGGLRDPGVLQALARLREIEKDHKEREAELRELHVRKARMEGRAEGRKQALEEMGAERAS